MATRTAATATSPEKMILGAGKIEIKAASGGSFVTIGATRGGASFDPGIPLRDIEADNFQGATKGFVVKDKGNPTLTTTILEITRVQLNQLLPGMTVSGNTIIGNGQIKATDYLFEVKWTGYRPHSTGVVEILLKDVLVKEPIGLTFSDNDEATVSVTFMAHFDPAAVETADGYLPEPYVITSVA
jgi:hypothetical protein